MRKCEVINRGDKKHCARRDVVLRHINNKGEVHDMCTLHIAMDKAGCVLTYHTYRRPRSHVADLGDTKLDLRTGTKYTQGTLIPEEPDKEGTMQFHLHSITKGGVIRGEGGFVRYFFWKKVKVNVANEGDLKAIIQRHFDREGEDKAAFVITTRFGVLKGYKRSNMEGVELSNCTLKQSKFSI